MRDYEKNIFSPTNVLLHLLVPIENTNTYKDTVMNRKNINAKVEITQNQIISTGAPIMQNDLTLI